jgi:hypothetical protein
MARKAHPSGEVRSMRACLFALIVSASPALADLVVIPGDCPAGSDCLLTFNLNDLAASNARPTVIGKTLVLVGIGPGPTGSRDRLMAVDVDLDGPPSISGVTELDATRTERRGLIEVAPDGTTYALFTEDERDHLNRNRRVGAIQFFDEFGQRLGRVSSPYAPDWPEGAYGSPVEVMTSFVGQNALRFANGRMALRFGRFVLSAGLDDGQVQLVETGEPSADDGLDAMLDRIFDPVGGEAIWVTPGLTGYFNLASDGAPPALNLATPPVADPLDVLGHTGMIPAELEPNRSDFTRSYASVTLSPDGAWLAVIRLTDNSCDPAPVTYRLDVYDTGTGKLAWSMPGTSDGVASLQLAWTPDSRLVLTEARGAVDPPCGPDPDAAAAVIVTIYDPHAAP